MMNLCEYQEKARSTEIYLEIKDSKMIYPALGIVGECGEVAEKIKKLIRDDGWNMTEDRKTAIAKELGDCCWYLANICCDTGHSLSMVYKMRGASTLHKIRGLIFPRLVLYMNRQAIIIATILEEWFYKYDCWPREIERYTKLPNSMSHLITCIEEIAFRCDFTLEDICDINLEKLSVRKDKGTLRGEGDNR